MTFSIRAIIRALSRRDRGIHFGPERWVSLLAELDRRGGRRHEAGAFLLGARTGHLREVQDVVFYDDLDPEAYSSGVCILHAPAFAALWSMCRARGLTVVGDVHTHPKSAFQSEADRTNPMVARDGHIAIIVPNFATGRPARKTLGVFEYRGNHAWTDHSGARARRFLHNDLWSKFL
ncbi:Mov34/MPN/PAD-1 family protein [Lichenicola sp.]|uniref:Mov34/MPN/PAD-1 family protein n=1 Tax=Lichenicola sp. TaxID=2804529 RepID=UPI003AFFA025